MVHRKPFGKVASIGVTHTQVHVEEELDWIFREQPTEDYGIDAHVEVVDGEDVRGLLLAPQNQQQRKRFDECATGGWWLRPDADHVTYWTSLELTLNKLGKAFLVVDAFATHELRQLTQ